MKNAKSQLDFDGFFDNQKFVVRPYQKRIITKALNMFQTGTTSILIESPTGSGKSVMGLLACKELQLRNPRLKIGWCAMRRNLLSQVEKENENRSIDLRFVTFSMFEKDPPEVDILVVDEAQHDAVDSMVSIHKATKAKKVLALSATPYRTDRVGLCFQKVIRDAGIQQLIREGWLSEYNHYTIPSFTPEEVAETFLRDPEKWGSSLVFFHTYQQCLKFSKLLTRAKISNAIVTGQTNREAQIESYESGQTQVLINMMILTEGFDSPRTKTVFVRPSQKGPSIQMGGRLFRLYHEFKVKHLVQSKDTKHPFQRTAVPRDQFIWEDGRWKSIKPNESVDLIAQKTVLLLMQTRASTWQAEKQESKHWSQRE